MHDHFGRAKIFTCVILKRKYLGSSLKILLWSFIFSLSSDLEVQVFTANTFCLGILRVADVLRARRHHRFIQCRRPAR
jgi:hypothetical protein